MIPLYIRFVLNIPYVQELTHQENFLYTTIRNSIATYLFGTWNYVPTIILGFILGYCIENYHDAYLFGVIGKWLLSIISVVLLIATQYWKRQFMKADYEFSAFSGYELHVYLVIHKLIYLMSNFWLVYGCATGRLGN